MRPLDHEDFAETFYSCLLPWLRQGQLHSLLAQPPFHAPADVQITPISKPLLKVDRRRKATGNLSVWPRLALDAKPNPYLAFFLTGKAELDVGVTEQLAPATGETAYGLYNIRMPQKGLLIFPPNIPTSDGTKPHWNEENTEPTDATILWVDILTEGAFLHTCRTVKNRHLAGPYRFIFDTRLYTLINLVIEEFQTQSVIATTSATSASMEIAYSLLQALLLSIARSLTDQEPQVVHPISALPIASAGSDFNLNGNAFVLSPEVQRACSFIQRWLNRRLTVEQISSQAFVSPAQLNRLFRAELGLAVMQYVKEQRLKSARLLLENTALPVHVIGENVGIFNSVYFSHMFREKMGMTPSQYRARRR